jgi:hypothetical protein
MSAGIWTKEAPVARGYYWYRADISTPEICWNAGKEFFFMGTDETFSPEYLSGNGEFWSILLESPK